MKTLQIAKRAVKLFAAEAKDLLEMGLASGYQGLEDHVSDEYVYNGIIINAAFDIAGIALGNVVNTKLHDKLVTKSPIIAKIFFNKTAANITTSIGLSNIGIRSYNAFKIRYNSAEFKRRRATRDLMGANFTLISVVN